MTKPYITETYFETPINLLQLSIYTTHIDDNQHIYNDSQEDDDAANQRTQFIRRNGPIAGGICMRPYGCFRLRTLSQVSVDAQV